jgi:anti-anti-sigma regulatory factor
MTMNAVSLTILQEAVGALDSTGKELVLDFSSMRRLAPAELGELEKLADRADQLGVRVVLRAVPIGVYRVLKLMKLAGRFAFRTD